MSERKRRETEQKIADDHGGLVTGADIREYTSSSRVLSMSTTKLEQAVRKLIEIENAKAERELRVEKLLHELLAEQRQIAANTAKLPRLTELLIAVLKASSNGTGMHDLEDHQHRSGGK